MRETAKAKRAFEDYFNLGPKRSLAKLAQSYGEAGAKSPPTKHLSTLEKWSAAHGWQARIEEREADIAAAALEKIKQTATESGYAVYQQRIAKLNELADLLFAEVLDDDKRWVPDVKQIGSGDFAEKVELVRFNSPLIARYLDTLGDIAAEMGERKQTHKLEGEMEVNVKDERFDRAVSTLAEALGEIISGPGAEQNGEVGSSE